jgi:CRP-like cAMP-binding protein
MSASIASAYAREVLARPQLPHAAVRLGLWLAACAEQRGGFPVETTVQAIMTGLDTEDVHAPGVGFRHETVNKSISTLEEEGLLTVEKSPFYKGPSRYTLNLTQDD